MLMVRVAVLMLIVLSPSAHSASCPLAKAALEGLLSLEQEGARDARLGRTINGDMQRYPDEDVVDWTVGEFRIIRDFELFEEKCEADSAVYRVVFTQIGITEGKGVGNRVILSIPARHVNLYRLVLSEGKWKVVNPPLPAVDPTAALADITAARNRMLKIKARKPLAVSQVSYLNHLESSIDALKRIICMDGRVD